MKRKNTVDRMNQTLSINSRSEEALKLEKKKKELTEELEELMAEYAKAVGRPELARRSPVSTENIYTAVTGAVGDVLGKKKKKKSKWL